MPRTTVVNGLVWGVPIAQASITPVIDGQDNDGSIPLILNQNLDNAPGHIRSDFYGFYDRIKLTIDTGLAIAHTGGAVRLTNGAIVAFAAAKIFLTASTVGYVWVEQTSPTAALIKFGAVLPATGFVLAAYATSATAVTSLIDLRDKVIDAIAPLSIPEQVSPWDPGDVICRASGIAKPGRWLWCDGASYPIATYPDLFAAIGYNGGSGANFRVPDYRGRSPVGVGTLGSETIALGQQFGSASITLTVPQMPPHAHAVNQVPHSHADSGHGHGIQVNDPGHDHFVGQYKGAALNSSSNDGIGAEVSTQGQGNRLRADRELTGITVGLNPSSANIQAANASIAVVSEGGGQPIDLRNPGLGCHFMIRY